MGDNRIAVHGRLVRVATLEDEWFEDVIRPEELITNLRDSLDRPDVLTFWQRLPDIKPQYKYPMEPDPIAALPITTYAAWWETQIDSKVRNMIRRAEKRGVVVRPTLFDDRFVDGMTSIFNETPIRQGKPFWHYGKDSSSIKREFSRFLFREEILGAYYGNELIGFIMIGNAAKYADIGQIISKIAHRDKAPNNLLIAKAVDRCAEKGIPFLVYAKWEDGSLGEFKRKHGFQRVYLPRYYAPLTFKGRIYVTLKLYKGVMGFLPANVRRQLKQFRRKLNEIRYSQGTNSSSDQET